MSNNLLPLSNLTSLEDALQGPKAVRESLTHQVYNKLRTAIVLSKLAPNTRLAQVEIAKQMGTSQAPVREALRQLERDGLVEYRPRSGTFVAELSGDKVFEVFSIRNMVECFAVRRAIVHFDGDKRDILNQLIEQMYRAADRDDLFTVVEYDLEFHRCLCRWAEHPALLNIWNPLYAQIQRYLIQTQRHHFPNLRDIAKTHKAIVEAMCEGNADEAARVIEEHVMQWARRELRNK
ncbi:MAG: GntR family transcriptional regulator [Anaerolineales bacterium]|nr:GntR family transcriptional regulator [Anaerolineales bacterium]